MNLECPYCHEQILEGEETREVNGGQMIFHASCLVRQIAGSLGHQLGTCHCFGGSGAGDPPGMTLRKAAEHAFAFYQNNPHGPRPPLLPGTAIASYDKFVNGVVDHLMTFPYELLPLALGALKLVEPGEQGMEIAEQFGARKRQEIRDG